MPNGQIARRDCAQAHERYRTAYIVLIGADDKVYDGGDMRDRRIQRIAENMTRDSVLEMAAHTIINIDDLQNAANVLLDNGLLGPACSIGIMALEELGKFAKIMGYLADNSDRKAFVNSVLNHKNKQRAGHVIALLAPAILSLRHRGAKSVEELFPHDSLTGIVDDLKLNINQLTSELEREIPEVERVIKEVETGEIEQKRQDGFYVSLAINEEDRVSVKYPRLITRADTERVVKILAFFRNKDAVVAIEPIAMRYREGADSESVSMSFVVDMLKKMVDDAVPLLVGPLSADGT